MFAFLGRYAHQPVDVLKRLSVVELQRLAEATGKLIREEAEHNRE